MARQKERDSEVLVGEEKEESHSAAQKEEDEERTSGAEREEAVGSDDDDDTKEEDEDVEAEAEKEQQRGGDDVDDDDDGAEGPSSEKSKVKHTESRKQGGLGSKCVPGVIYLGHIPPRLRPKHLRNMLSPYGEIGRIFLQPEDRRVRTNKKKAGIRRCDFTEGWVEFRDKRVAKRVALSLHNTSMATRKRQHFSSDLWNIKYLHRFQWIHLSERLAYEQQVLKQRLRTEVSQAKRETNFYLDNVEKSLHQEKSRKKRQRNGEQMEEKTWDFTQRRTEEEIQMRKRERAAASNKQLDKARIHQQKSQSNISLLAKIFNSSQSQ